MNERYNNKLINLFKCNKQNPPPSKIDKNIGGGGGWSENSAGLVLWVGVSVGYGIRFFTVNIQYEVDFEIL